VTQSQRRGEPFNPVAQQGAAVLRQGNLDVNPSADYGRQLPLKRGACCVEVSPHPSFIWGCTPCPAFCCGEGSPHPSLWSYALHTALTFLIREKSAKAYARGHPLHNPEGGTSPLCGVDFPHSALKGTFPLADEETTLSAKGERDRRSLRG